MNTEQGYYLRIKGEQKGPYTLAHVRHLFSAGFIDAATPFWHEAFDEWQEVALLTKLLELRKPRFAWVKPLVWLVAIGVLAVLGYICFPVLKIAINETWQTECTAEAAYWKARQHLREETKPHKGLLNFAPFAEDAVSLTGNKAVVQLNTLEEPSRVWKVTLVYEVSRREWKPASLEPK